jgi:hypothetical protein
MKLTRSLLAVALSFSLSLVAFIALPIHTVTAQDSRIALQRGFRTGYSDGYMAGYRDSIDNSTRDFNRHGEYSKANRAYNKEYGAVEDYSDGYRQGFESGYSTGFEKRSFEATVPADLTRRGNSAPAIPTPPSAEQSQNIPAETPPLAANPAPQPENTAAVSDSTPEPAISEELRKPTFTPVSDAVIIIPRDTEIIVEMIDDLGTGRSREGDKFTSKVISPTEIAGAIIEGRVNKITKPGRLKRRSELQLSFDRIILSENRWSNMNALMTEVMPVKGDNVKRVDNEGMAVGNRSYKQDGVKIGAATGTGVVIGAIAGGPVGAAVGAGVGAAFGVGAVVIERGKNININRNQQIRVKTSYETQIR